MCAGEQQSLIYWNVQIIHSRHSFGEIFFDTPFYCAKETHFIFNCFTRARHKIFLTIP